MHSTCLLLDCAEKVRQVIAAFDPPAAEHSVSPNEQFNAFALELFGLQFTNNSAYRLLCQSRGISPEQVEHWTQIPAVPTSTLRSLTCHASRQPSGPPYFIPAAQPRKSRAGIFTTPHPWRCTRSSLWPWFRRHVVPDGLFRSPRLNLLVLTPPLEAAPHSSLVHMFHVISRELGPGNAVSAGAVDSQGRWILDLDRARRALGDSADRDLILGQPSCSCTSWIASKTSPFVYLSDSGCSKPGVTRADLEPSPRRNCTRLFTAAWALSQTEFFAIRDERTRFAGVDHALQEPDAGPATRCFHFPPWARARLVSP